MTPWSISSSQNWEGLESKSGMKEGEAIISALSKEKEASKSHHGSTDCGWWGVTENYIKKVEKMGDHWGVVFLMPKERFWVDGRNFRTIVTGDLDEANGYNVHRDRLKESSSANRFSSVKEFLSISGLR